MSVTLNRPDLTLIDETNKKAALINIKIPIIPRFASHNYIKTTQVSGRGLLNQATVATEQNCC
jgi:hypothetical protein